MCFYSRIRCLYDCKGYYTCQIEMYQNEAKICKNMQKHMIIFRVKVKKGASALRKLCQVTRPSDNLTTNPIAFQIIYMYKCLFICVYV